MSVIRRAAAVAALLVTIAAGGLVPAGGALADDFGGTWTKKSFKIAGEWKIVTTDEGRFLELDDAFKTRKAPDLKLFLSPLPAADVKAKNATSGSVLISPLDSARGAQRYKLPDDLDLADFQTLVLHCEKYTKLWGVSALR